MDASKRIGSFTLINPIGQGAMGEVWRAVQNTVCVSRERDSVRDARCLLHPTQSTQQLPLPRPAQEVCVVGLASHAAAEHVVAEPHRRKLRLAADHRLGEARERAPAEGLLERARRRVMSDAQCAVALVRPTVGVCTHSKRGSGSKQRQLAPAASSFIKSRRLISCAMCSSIIF